MFPSQTLMTTIHADRLRDFDRVTRERRLLAGAGPEPAPTMPVPPPTIAMARPTGRTERSGGPARGAV